METTSTTPSFFAKNEFLIRRLHSLSGLVPVGAYMCVHLLTNASILDSSTKFNWLVSIIHSLGGFLPVIEWGFIFLPLIFHTVIGFIIVGGGVPNTSTYNYSSNRRYKWQRISGMIAFVFIFWHVFHLHGWFHFDLWMEQVAKPIGGANFRPYNAASSLGLAMAGFIVPVLYALGMLACVYHLANGIWTMGITWGIWISPTAQTRAGYACLGFGVLLGFVGLGAVIGAKTVDTDLALIKELETLSVSLISNRVTPEEASHKVREDVTEEELAELIKDMPEDRQAALKEVWHLAIHGHDESKPEEAEDETALLDSSL